MGRDGGKDFNVAQVLILRIVVWTWVNVSLE